MVGSMEADAKGRGSRWGVTSRRAKAPHLPTEGRYGPRDMWATSDRANQEAAWQAVVKVSGVDFSSAAT